MRASHFWKLREGLFSLRRRFGVVADPLPLPSAADIATTDAALGDPYQLYRMIHRRSDSDLRWMRELASLLVIRNRIDLILDAHLATSDQLEATLSSIRDQMYPYWSIRVTGDPHDATLGRWLARAAEADPRVSCERWNGARVDPESSFAVVGAGDLLESEALLLVAIELHRGADVVYTDEDRLRIDGAFDEPRFKPDWSPETALTRDYVGRLCAVRGAAVLAAGGLDETMGTAVWHEAVLRVAERSKVVHVAHVAYHRRVTSAPMVAEDAKRAVESVLRRKAEAAIVKPTRGGLVAEFAVPRDEHVAVIVPTRDQAALLDGCLRSLFGRTLHAAFEVVVVDNGSVEPATHELFARWKRLEASRFRVIEDYGSFNFSRLNNRAVATVTSSYIVLLNNDTEVIEPGWMTAMLGQARRAPIGAVGALLLYEDGTVQHGGVVLGGVLGLAGHAYRNVNPESDGAPLPLRLDTNYLAVTGACLMVSRAKFDEVGGLDESLAVAYNDVDLCLKLYSAGYRNVLVPRARLYHHESRTRGDDDTHVKRERALQESETIRRRWPALARSDPYYNSNLTLGAEDFSVRL